MKRILILTILIGLTAFSLLFVRQLKAQTTPTLSTNPTTINLTGAGQPATFAINIANATNITAYGFTMSFNPAVLQFTSFADGGWLGSTGNTVVPLNPVVDNINGTVQIGAFALASNNGPNGSGTLGFFYFFFFFHTKKQNFFI